MRYLFLGIIFIHGLIHLLGFIHGSGLGEVKGLTIPVSKSMAFLWLIASFLVIIYGIAYFADCRYNWLFGFFAFVLSQILIIIYWKDAKFGTIPNAVIIILSIISYGYFNFQNLVQQETIRLISQVKTLDNKVVSQQDIKNLPGPVKRWLYSSGIVGKPYIMIGRVLQEAEMKIKPEQKKWFSAKAIQYTTIDLPGFIWSVDVKMNSLVGFQGRDKFENGKGEMLIKLNSLIKVALGRGEKINEGTIQRYIGEMVWFPSLALSPYIKWQEVDNNSAIATMEYEGTKASGTFYFNAEGDFVKFTAMRFMGNEPLAKKYQWVLLVEDYKFFEGIKVPSKMTATWKLEKEDWTWLKLEIKDIKYNEAAIGEKFL